MKYQVIQYKIGTEIMGEGETLEQAIADANEWGETLQSEIPELPKSAATVGEVYWRVVEE